MKKMAQNSLVPRSLTAIITPLVALLASCSQPASDTTNGTLRVSDINPRYFTDNSGTAVYLTGSHTWNNLVDMDPGPVPEQFDFASYVDWMRAHNHNFMRLWTWELMNWDTQANNEGEPRVHTVSPQPWMRTGPGTALDGGLKFDLARMNPEYFDRLKQRMNLAAESGIYVSVMLFEGWGIQFSPNAFENHPFHPENNINDINGDPNGDGIALEIHEMGDERITAIQRDYVQHVIETINEFDNVLFEISNENHPPSTDWQYGMIKFIKDTERALPKQHPVGMTFQYRGGSNQTLFDSPADWISPNGEGGYRDDPPPGDGSKVIITDTDHLWGIGGNSQWVWKSFLRGLNPIFMDPYEAKVLRKTFDPEWVEPLRKSMGQTLMLSQRMDLIHMVPAPDLVTTRYCLANVGSEYLVYLPEGPEVTIDLIDTPGVFEAEWFDPGSGEFSSAETVEGGARLTMSSPFGSPDAVLHLKSR
jgi:hypothetical protein